MFTCIWKSLSMLNVIWKREYEHLINIHFLHNHLGWSWDLNRESRTVFKALFGLYWAHLDVTSCMAPMDMSAGRLVVASVWESCNQTHEAPTLQEANLLVYFFKPRWLKWGATRFNSYLIFPSIVLAISDSVYVRRCVYTHSSTHFKIIN